MISIECASKMAATNIINNVIGSSFFRILRYFGISRSGFSERANVDAKTQMIVIEMASNGRNSAPVNFIPVISAITPIR